MEEINELIRHYHLQEDIEHVIIPFISKDGRKKRCFLLKRRFIRIMFPEGNFVDSPLTEAIEATVKYPDIRLSEAIKRLHEETGGKVEALDADGQAEGMDRTEALQ